MKIQKLKKAATNLHEKWTVFAITLMATPLITGVAHADPATGKIITVPAVQNIGLTLSDLMSSGGTLASVLTGGCLISGGIGYIMDRSIKGLLLGALAGIVVTGGLTAMIK